MPLVLMQPNHRMRLCMLGGIFGRVLMACAILILPQCLCLTFKPLTRLSNETQRPAALVNLIRLPLFVAIIHSQDMAFP